MARHMSTSRLCTLAIACLLAATLAGCSGASVPTLAPNITAQQHTGAGQSMGLSFPPETRFLLYHRQSEQGGLPGPDDAVHLKIELPSSALAAFLDQPPFVSAKWSSSDSRVTDVAKWPEWRPSQVKQFRSEQFKLPNGEAIQVLIDDDQEETKVVYLFWFET
jgi:hypothetical protein